MNTLSKVKVKPISKIFLNIKKNQVKLFKKLNKILTRIVQSQEAVEIAVPSGLVRRQEIRFS